MISFFLNKKLNLLYLILPVYGLVSTLLIMTYQWWGLDLGLILVNPALVGVLSIIAFDDMYRDANMIQYQLIFVVVPNLIYWIPATFIIIKIIERVRKLEIFRKSKAAIP